MVTTFEDLVVFCLGSNCELDRYWSVEPGLSGDPNQLTHDEMKSVVLEAIQGNPVYTNTIDENPFLDDKGEAAKANFLIGQLAENG